MTSRVGGWGSIGRVTTPAGGASRAGEVARFTPAEQVKVPVKEASDVAALPGGRLLIVGDTSDKVGLLGPDGKLSKIKLEGLKGTSELEGVAYDPVHHNLFVSREEDRQVLRYDWNPDKKKDPELKHTYDVKHVGGPENKGLEGLTFLDGDKSPTGLPQLLAAKEGKPRELLMFDAAGGKKGTKIDLDPSLKDVCKDFSAIAVDPKSGDLFLSSDESSVVAQLHLQKKGDGVEAKLVQSFPVRDSKDKPLARIEGLAFNEKGDLFVLTENDGGLHKLARQ